VSDAPSVASTAPRALVTTSGEETDSPHVAAREPGGVAATSGAHACHIDERPCEVEVLFAHHLPAETAATALEQYGRCLPCHVCRYLDGAPARLTGLRLGKREREVLLKAAPPSAKDGTKLVADVAARAERESTLRAVRRLFGVGLLAVGRAATSRTRTVTYGYGGKYDTKWNYYTRAVWLSEFGEAIVGRCRAELESGRRIRWGDRVLEALRAVRPDARALLALYAKDVRRHMEYHGKSAALLGRIGTSHSAKSAHEEVRVARAGVAIVTAIEKATESESA